MKRSLRVKITVIFSSIQLNLTYTTISSSIQLLLTRTIGPSYYFINLRLLKQVIFCDENIYQAVGQSDLGISTHNFAYLRWGSWSHRKILSYSIRAINHPVNSPNPHFLLSLHSSFTPLLVKKSYPDSYYSPYLPPRLNSSKHHPPQPSDCLPAC